MPNKIYVACPSYVRTGGTELLHQFVHTLNTRFNIPCFIFYYDVNWKFEVPPTPKAFEKYITSGWVDKIEDNPENILVIGETNTRLLGHYSRIRKCVWWLSIDYFFTTNRFKYKSVTTRQKIKFRFKKILKKEIFNEIENIFLRKNDIIYHLTQSQYATDFLLNLGITNILELSDYLNEDFLKENSIIDVESKKNIVVYNPLKGIEFTRQLIERSPNIQWFALEKMTSSEVAQKLREAKVYIDFGEHPGKDRIPREAVISGCCIITGKKGAANNPTDIPISEKYKFEDKDTEIPAIQNLIKDIFENYKDHQLQFKEYKKVIISSEKKFEEDLRVLISKLNLQSN